MTSYNADINLNIVGASRLNAVVSSVAKLNALAQDLKPINLVAPGGGQLGNKIREAIKPINDFAREVTNGTKRISNTFAGASQQADVFRTVLDNVKVAAGGFSRQIAPVKLYATALTEAQTQARKLNAAQQDLLRTSRGLQLQDERNVETSRRLTRVLELRRQQTQGAALAQRGRESASNAVIGGAFPLLFGQGTGAALGGGLGGALGGAFGGTLGFGLSLVGTAIGQAIDDAKKLNREISSLNNNLDTTGSTSRTTASDIYQLASQLSIAKDEALKLVAAFSEFASADVREALATSFGAVGGEEAFNALAAAIDNKTTLEAIVKLRDTITDIQAKEALKQLQLNGAVAANVFLQERLLELQEKELIKKAENIRLTDRLLAAAAALGAQGQFIDPAIFGQERAEQIRRGAAKRKGVQKQALQDTRNFLSEVSRLNEQFSTQTRTRTGPKPPEDRTRALQADLQAIIEIGNAEDLIRDFRFEGQDILATEVELAKAIADIERDRIKQLEQANYETERSVINQIAKNRALNEERRIADTLRDITTQRFEDELRAQEAVRDAVKPITDVVKQQQLQSQYSKTYLRLVTEGMLPAEAERIANFEKLVKEQLSAKEEQISITELALLEAKARGASTVELEKQLKVFKAQQEAIKGEAAKGPGAAPTNRERLQSEIAAVQGQLNTLLDPINQVTTAAEGIGFAFSDSFKGIVSGTMTAQEALAGFFQNVADQFLDMAAQITAKWIQLTILNSLFKLFPSSSLLPRLSQGVDIPIAEMPAGMQFRANGGSVSSGSPYIVGERGPELFVPGRSGTIVSNDKMTGSNTSVVVNVDASGSKVQGDNTEAGQLGRAIAAAVQMELVKQKRPGGILA